MWHKASNVCVEVHDLRARCERLEDALDHIARVARNSISQSKRNRWIQARAEQVLRGDDYDGYNLPDYPKMNIESGERLRKKNAELRHLLAQFERALQNAPKPVTPLKKGEDHLGALKRLTMEYSEWYENEVIPEKVTNDKRSY